MTLKYAAMKSGKGRPTGKPRAVVEVESLPCDSTLGSETHELHNDARGVTRCCFCLRTWAEIDAAARGGAA